MAAAPPAMSRDELAAWLWLLESPGLGRVRARKLLGAFGSPEAVRTASPGQWRDALGDGSAQTLLPRSGQADDALIDRTWHWLQEDPRRGVVSLGEPQYPAALLALPDPPLLLYTCGQAGLLQHPSLAIVGSRNPTAQGAENAHQFAVELGRAGLVIVSGLASGIDAAAHRGALAAPVGTVAVVGTGLDRIYPSSHRELAHLIAETGLLLSEFALGTPPLAANFPQRNRIIAGLGLGTLVVEAAVRSGSLITARIAAEIGREVFALPGSIHSPQSKGCHALIKQGAKLVEGTQDILEELHLAAPAHSGRTRRAAQTSTVATPDHHAQPASPPQQPDEDTGATHPILNALGHEPASFDVLQVRTGYSAAQLGAELLMLELAGHIERLPGQIFQRVVRA